MGLISGTLLKPVNIGQECSQTYLILLDQTQAVVAVASRPALQNTAVALQVISRRAGSSAKVPVDSQPSRARAGRL